MIHGQDARATLGAESLAVGYGERVVLRDVSCEVTPGACLGIIGPNGAGKTTLLRALSGVLPSAGGRVTLGDRDVSTIDARERARSIAYVAQSLHVPLPHTVEQLAALGRTPHLGRWTPFKDRDHLAVKRAIHAVELDGFEERFYDELSAGEQQRAVLAMALAQEPAILLLDEPTAHLDLHFAWQILAIVRRLAREHQLAVALSTHDLNLAAEFCSSLVLLRDGKVIASGTKDDVLKADILSSAYGHPIEVIPHQGRILVLPANHAHDSGR
ncbi:MAG TPA: ABC transporter ATP-binding protein [Kiritimatiellia bacterium]